MAENNEEKGPFTRPGFVAAAVVIAIVVALGLGLIIVNMIRDDPDPAPSIATSAEPTSAATASKTPEAVGGASVCGLAGEVLKGRLTAAPAADWQYQDTTAYPTSTQFGPGKTNADGLRYCFQHSPEGALFAAANAVVQGSNSELARVWLDYFVADGPHRDAVLSQGSGPAGRGQGARIAVTGFRLLAYDGQTARVDIAVRGTTGGQTVNLSMVYLLVWEGGDWKLRVTNPKTPINVAKIPDLAGYISWGA